MSGPALLIIDMQKCMAERPAEARNNPQAEANIARLLAAWRGVRMPIIHVRHISKSPRSGFWPGQAGAEFQEALMPLAGEHIVEKNIPDAFTLSGLERWLRVRSIDELVIVGVSTNNSVESSARSAGNLGFNTKVVSDATYAYGMLDYAGTPRSAVEVHAMALANLQTDYATIISTAEALAQAHPPSPA